MQLVQVEWEDVAKTMNDDNFDNSVDIDSRLVQMKTIGWIHQQTKKTLLLAQESMKDSGEDAVRDWVAIPKVLITKITPLKVKEKERR